MRNEENGTLRGKRTSNNKRDSRASDTSSHAFTRKDSDIKLTLDYKLDSVSAETPNGSCDMLGRPYEYEGSLAPDSRNPDLFDYF